MIETADIVAVAEEYAASVPERLLALDDLEAIVLRINELYRTRGYLASRAYLPPQEIVDGIVRIAVVEGRLGAIVASSTASLTPQVIENHLRRLEEGQVVERAPIVRATLLLNDLPGIEATATLRAGALPGTTDLTVHVRDTDRFTGSLGVDNHGSRSSGAVRAVLNAQANNPLGYSDQLAVSFNSAGTGTRYARIAYEGPVNFNELRLRLAHAVNAYRLGEEFAVLESTGESSTWSATARYPWLRTESRNAILQLELAQSRLKDQIGAVPVDDRSILAATASVTYEQTSPARRTRQLFSLAARAGV